jgi:hypothetical protein
MASIPESSGECMGCSEGIEAVRKHDAEAFKEYGWFAHIVPDPDFPNGMNYHTHGLDVSYNHKDIQVCLSINPKLIHSLVSDVIDQIKKGQTFESGQVVSRIVRGMNVTFANAKEDNRDVLRMIFPDSAGLLDRKNMVDERFKAQYDGTTP